MLFAKTTIRKTKRGTVVNAVREHYLRTDLWCGSERCQSCTRYQENTSLEQNASELLLLDAAVVLYQIDMLESPAIKNCIILESVVNQTLFHLLERTSQVCVYSIITFDLYINRETFIERKETESAADYELNVLLTAYNWYTEHLKSLGINVVLIVNSEEALKEVKAKGAVARTVEDYAQSRTDEPLLLDLLSLPNTADEVESSSFTYPNTEISAGIKEGRLLQGVLHANLDNCFEAFVSYEANGEQILIQGRLNLNRAVDSDIVAIEMLPKEQWVSPSSKIIEDEDNAEENDTSTSNTTTDSKATILLPTGRVVGIVKRNWRPYCGTLLPSNVPGSQYLLFAPIEKQIPRIRIRTRQAETLLAKRIVVAIDRWDRNSKYPMGHYVRDLGPIGDKETETEALLVQYGVPHHPFSQAVLDCLPQLPWIITDEDRKQRWDLTALPICSIDPPGCTDIDDALHVRRLDNGNLEVGVHIADVTHFVLPGTAIDEEAAKRSTTVYLVDKRIDMLPKLLGENLCSLVSNQPRFAFSVLWEMTDSGDIVNTKYGKSIILSRASLTYEAAQNRIDDERMQDELTVGIRQLNKIAKIYRQRRIDNGALTLASLEMKMIRNEDMDVIDIGAYELRETNALVEEFMLLANISVAEKIYEHFPHISLLRRHPAPPAANFGSLAQALNLKHFNLKIDNSKILANSLDKIQLTNDPYFNKLIRVMTTRSMLQAVYFCSGTQPFENFFHYGLSVPIYTHFTSPIRRYADVIVHRLLASAIGATTESTLLTVDRVKRIADEINRRHKAAQDASRDSTRLHTYLFFKERAVEESAYVTKVRENGFFVLVPKFGIEEIIFVCQKNQSNPFVYDAEHQRLTSKVLGCQIEIFQQVKVRIDVDTTNTLSQKIRLQCIEPLIPLPAARKK